jgi:hypothetical protein
VRHLVGTDYWPLTLQDDAAGDHVNSEHFTKAMKDMPQALVETPQIISEKIGAGGWGRMGELRHQTMRLFLRSSLQVR